MRIASLLAMLAMLATPSVASADVAPKPVRTSDAPCKGCRSVVPGPGRPERAAPLLVLLHGDAGPGPTALVDAWERHALPRGVALLALQCPAALGCKGSWWQWNGAPSWLTAQVDAFAASHPIDRARVWLAGWSGGASYMGHRSAELQRSFAALVYHGGGMPPPVACEAEAPRNGIASVYFLVGDANPLHGLALRLRQHHENCKDTMVWKLLPGADHAAEWRGLEANGGAIVPWLLAQRPLTATAPAVPGEP